MAEYFHINYEFSHDVVLERIREHCVCDAKAAYLCVVDGNVLVQVHRDQDYREVVQGALFSICDSSWVPLYLRRIYGFKPSQYSGSEIFRDITDSRSYRMAFLGASSDVLNALRDRLSAGNPGVQDMLFMDLPFLSVEDFDYEAIASVLNADRPDIVWVALGAPKQERFAARLAPLLDRGVILPVGAVFNFFSGTGIRRAPDWMVRMHLEFVYRIFREPRKQWRRVRNILCFTPAILREERIKAASCKDSSNE